MDASSIALIMDLLCEGVGVATKISDLARRVKAGEQITDAEIQEARKSVDDAIEDWNDAG